MKKLCAFLLAAALLLALSVGCLAASGLNTGIQIDDSQAGKILVTVADSDSESFETLQPTLTVACTFSVFLGSSSVRDRQTKLASVTVKPLEQFRRYQTALPYYRNVVREGIRYAGT